MFGAYLNEIIKTRDHLTSTIIQLPNSIVGDPMSTKVMKSFGITITLKKPCGSVLESNR